MSIHKNIKPLIQRIKTCDWFINVGTGDLPDASRAKSWKDVYKKLKSVAWDKMKLAVLNEYHKAHAQTPDNDKYDFDEVFDVVDIALEESLLPVIEENNLPGDIIDSLRGNVMCLTRSLVYFGPNDQSFDRRIVELYLAGYCPCGYQGTYPRGKLIVY